MLPGAYCFISAQTAKVIEYFNTDGFTIAKKLSSIPSLSNQGGCLSLMNLNGLVIDSVCYSPEMHHPALTESKGVSLERVLTTQSGLKPQNWHSASTLMGGGSPGRLNTQTYSEGGLTRDVTISSKVISPDNDGIDDFLVLSWSNLPIDAYLETFVFDLQGRLVGTLGDEGVSGANGQIVWSGTDKDGKMLAPGHYMLKVRFNTADTSFMRKFAIGIYYVK